MKGNMKNDYSNIDDVIISFLKDRITGNEREILQKWLEEDISHKEHFRQLYKIWAAAEKINEDANEIEKVLERTKFQINGIQDEPKPQRTLMKRVLLNAGKWAAVIFISLLTGALIYSRYGKTSSASLQANFSNEITVPLGSKSKIRLPDGTEVLLNAGSKLTYTMDYGRKLREVEFSGEAYFKVAKQKDKPFIVHTSKANIKALGTEFNVKAYPNENFVETILVEGSVAINRTEAAKDNSASKKNDIIILKPGQKLQIIEHPSSVEEDIVTKSSGNAETISNSASIESLPDMKLASSDVRIETSWKDKRWIIRGTDLEDLAVLFSRRFNVDIHLKDSTLKKFKFSGMIENETLEEVLKIMKYTIPITCKVNKGDVTWSIDRVREKDFKEAY